MEFFFTLSPIWEILFDVSIMSIITINNYTKKYFLGLTYPTRLSSSLGGYKNVV